MSRTSGRSGRGARGRRGSPARGALAVALALTAVAPRGAQGSEQPLVRVRLEPGHTVMVGEPARLVVDVLTPTWFFSAPKLPMLDLKDAFVLLQDRGQNLNERLGDATFSGVEREYLVYPMRPGVLEIPSFEVTVVYAIDAKRSEPTALATEPLRLEATVPAEAAGLGYFVAATRLGLDQRLEPEPKGLKVGDSLRRTIQISAEGAFAMMLPPTTFETIEGLTAYPAPPEVEDQAGERGAARTARRVDSVAYRLEREGEYRLPGVEVVWWDVEAKQLRTASVPPVAFSVVAAPPGTDEIPLPPDEAAASAGAPAGWGWRQALRRRAPWLLGAALLLVLVARPRARWVLRLRASIASWRQRRRGSEPAAFRRLQRAAASGDALPTYQALLSWLSQRTRGTEPATLDAFLKAAGDDELDGQVARLQARLYGRSGAEDTFWSGPVLVERLRSVRRRPAPHGAAAASGLQPLNPTRARPVPRSESKQISSPRLPGVW